MKTIKFEFFKDESGRLCVRTEGLPQIGFQDIRRQPVERRDGARYKFVKCTGLYHAFERHAELLQNIAKLQTAQAGDVVEISVEG